MPTGRENADGFKGDYPKPLDWERIDVELLARSKEQAAAGRNELEDAPDSGE